MPSGGILQLIEGAAEIAGGAALDIWAGGAGGIGNLLIKAGIGTTISGIGSLISGDKVQGKSITERNSITPWRVGYGRTAPKNDIIYLHQWGAGGLMLDMVMIVYDHSCQSIDEVLLDQQRLQIDTTAIPTSALAGYSIPAPAAGAGTSFTPVGIKGNPQWINATSISVSNDVVTIVLPSDIPYLTAGDPIIVQNNGGTSYQATFPVAQIISRVPSGSTYILTFTILNGGSMPSSVRCSPQWINYARCVYFEPLLGNQMLGQTFVGMTAGTPWNGTGKLCTPLSPQNAGSDDNFPAQTNPWMPNASCMGKTLVFLRFQLDTKFFPGGLPLISFRAHGKNNIYDPRLGACTGVKAAGMSATGHSYAVPALYGVYDVLNLVQSGASGGQITVTGVDGSGHITSFVVTSPGTGYSLGACTVTGGHGTGATFVISALTGAAGCNVYSENPVLCIADYLTDLTWGYKYQYGTDIPLAMLQTNATVCDTATALTAGGTEPLYACNGQFDTDQTRGEILQNMLTSCAARISAEPPFTIQPGYWTGATVSPVDLQAIAAGPYQWKGPTIHDLFNCVKGTYISPNNKWLSTDYPPYAQDADHGYSGPLVYAGDINLPVDNGERRTLELNLPFTISCRQAQYTAKVEMLRRRWANLGIPPNPAGPTAGIICGGSGTFACHMAAFQFAPLDVFLGTVGFLGISGQAMEVTVTRLKGEEAEGAIRLGVDVEVQLTDSSIYAWSTAEELTAQGYQQTSLPSGQVAEEEPWPWSPGYAVPLAGDAVYPQGASGPATFGLQPVYSTDASGNPYNTLQIKGCPPINALDTEIGKPQIIGAQSAGGSLADGLYVIGLSAFDAGGANRENADYLDFTMVLIQGGGGTASIACSITWGSGDDGGDIYMAAWNPDTYVFHWQQTVSPGAATANIASFNQAGAGGPDPDFDHFGIDWQLAVHTGLWLEQVQAVTATTVTIASYTAGDVPANQFAGYILSFQGAITQGVEIPVINMPVASNTASSGSPVQFVLTIGPNAASVQLPDLTTLLKVGDWVVMRAKWTFTANSMSDSNVANAYYPSGATSVEAGHVAVVLSGADQGDVQTIAGVSLDIHGNSTIFNLASQWAIQPATGDIVIICAPGVIEVPTPALSVKNSVMGGPVIAQPNVTNLANQAWLIRVRTEDANGNYGPDYLAPMRDVLLLGVQGTRVISAASAFPNMLTMDYIPQFNTATPANAATTDSLGAAITSSTQTAISLTSGAGTCNNTYLKIGTGGSAEIVYIVSGGGTANLTVQRGQLGTTAAASWANTTTVAVPGWNVFGLQALAGVPNQSLVGSKITSDLNFVKIVTNGTDTVPGGGNTIILADTSSTRGTVALIAPAGGSQWIQLPSAGASGATGTGGGGTLPTILPQTLSGSTTVITATAPTVAGQQLFVILTQSGGGGNQITWGSTFSTDTPVDINQLANAVTKMQFIGRSISGTLTWDYMGVVA